MAALKHVKLFKVTGITQQIFTRNFHLNPVLYAKPWSAKYWRADRNLPENPNAFGPLTNLPDYSFIDGRTVPFGTHQKKRIDEQRENLKRIKELVAEIDYAVLKHEKRLKSAEEERQNILNRKLKPKGDRLLTDDTEQSNILDGKSNERESKLLTDDAKKSS